MGKKISVKPGDIITIKFDDSHSAIGKVVYVSKKMKFGMCIAIAKKGVSESVLPGDFSDESIMTLYTSTEGITSSRWHIVSHQPITLNESKMAKRIVAGEVWVNDEVLGPASDEDYKKLPMEIALGLALVEKKIKEALLE